ncbi:hypothetical protein ACJZ2D_005598 [Fusarium nematophilum]
MTQPKLQTIKGPAIFVAQYLSDEAPYNSLEGIMQWASGLGYKGLQIPIDDRLIDIKRAADDQDYCDQLLALGARYNIRLTELSSHMQGQLIAVHPAYDKIFDGFAPLDVRGDSKARQAWAHDTLLAAAKASKNLGMTAHATFSGALAWPYIYPWPQRPEGLVETAFQELAARWKPILDAFDEAGVDEVDGHRRACILYDPSHFVLQQLDYLEFVDLYHDRIKIFHAKDAEFQPNGRQGVYGGYTGWTDRAGRFRALGDGQVDFKGIFTRLARYGYDGWAVLESECAFKDKFVCAREGAGFISAHIIPVTDVAFDDFAGSEMKKDDIRNMLGLSTD